jgi:hypothetical protein
MFPLSSLGASSFLLGQFQFIRSGVLGKQIRVRRTQRAKASNQNIIVGNIGAVRTGVQSASPVNVA